MSVVSTFANTWGASNISVGQFTLPDSSTANCLRITASSSSQSGWVQTNANYNGTGSALQSWDHGSFFARMWMPPGNAMWPAFAMLTTTQALQNGTVNPEVDVVEMGMGSGTGTTGVTLSDFNVYQTVHLAGSNNGQVNTYVAPTNCSSGWHIYGCTFAAGAATVTFWFDGVQTVAEIGNTTVSAPWYLILTLIPGGSQWFGAPTGDVYPQNMFVDYVRVYQ